MGDKQDVIIFNCYILFLFKFDIINVQSSAYFKNECRHSGVNQKFTLKFSILKVFIDYYRLYNVYKHDR